MDRQRIERGLLLSLLLALGCSSPSEQTLAERSSAMISGQPSPVGGEDDAVLLLRATAENEVLCTATLVASNLVLTTRHCVAYLSPGAFQCTPEGELVPNPAGGGVLGADYPVDTITLYGAELPRDEPLAGVTQVLSTVSNTICKNDIAFLVLDRELDREPRSVRTSVQTEAGEPVVLVGYGATATGQVLDYQKQERRRRDDLTVVEVGPDSVEDGVKTAPPRTLRFQGPASCQGDSGGPAFSKASGAVIGAFSVLASSDCSANKVSLIYTHTAPFATLVQQAFEAAGAEPTPEPTPDAGELDAGGLDAGESDAATQSSEPPAPDGGCSVASPSDERPSWVLALAFLLWRLRPRARNRS